LRLSAVQDGWGEREHVLTVRLGTLEEGILINERGVVGSIACMAGWAFHNHVPPLHEGIVEGSREKSTALTADRKKNYNSQILLQPKERVCF
jgi:hypothetical protein